MGNLAVIVDGVRLRESPSTSAAILLTTTAPRNYASVVGKAPPSDASGHQWLQLRLDDGSTAWARCDVIWRIVGDLRPLGVGAFDEPKEAAAVFPPVNVAASIGANNAQVPAVASGKWSSPVSHYSITQPYGVGGHRGTDLGATSGAAIVSTMRGIVYRALECTACRPDAPNLISQGLSYNTRIGSDLSLGWSYGFGHCLVIRVAWADWPDAAKQALAAYAGGYAFVTLAHMLNKPVLKVGQAVKTGDKLGEVGMTGNADGPHLHAQVDISLNDDPANPWTGSDVVIVDPDLFFAF